MGRHTWERGADSAAQCTILTAPPLTATARSERTRSDRTERIQADGEVACTFSVVKLLRSYYREKDKGEAYRRLFGVCRTQFPECIAQV